MPRKKQVDDLTPIDQDKEWFTVCLGRNYFKSYGRYWNIDLVKGPDSIPGVGPRIKIKFKCEDGQYAEIVMEIRAAAVLVQKVVECLKEWEKYLPSKTEEIA